MTSLIDMEYVYNDLPNCIDPWEITSDSMDFNSLRRFLLENDKKIVFNSEMRDYARGTLNDGKYTIEFDNCSPHMRITLYDASGKEYVVPNKIRKAVVSYGDHQPRIKCNNDELLKILEGVN